MENFGTCTILAARVARLVRSEGGEASFSRQGDNYTISPDGLRWASGSDSGDALDLAKRLFDVATLPSVTKALGWESKAVEERLGREERLTYLSAARLYAVMAEARAFYQERLAASADARATFAQRGIPREVQDKFLLGYAAPFSFGKAPLVQHLMGKGFSADTILEAGLCASNKNGGLFDSYNSRLVIPIADEFGHTVAFTGRVTGDSKDERKYLLTCNSPIFSKQTRPYCMGEALAALREGSALDVVLVEGHLDAIITKAAGMNVICIQGVSMPDDLKERLLSYAPALRLALDDDKAGRNATMKILADFAQHGRAATVITPPGAKDLGEFIGENGRTTEDIKEEPGMRWLGSKLLESDMPLVDRLRKVCECAPNLGSFLVAATAVIRTEDEMHRARLMAAAFREFVAVKKVAVSIPAPAEPLPVSVKI